MKDMFSKDGFPSPHDGRCGGCPFWIIKEDRQHCVETEQDVGAYIANGRINKNCPFIQRG